MGKSRFATAVLDKKVLNPRVSPISTIPVTPDKKPYHTLIQTRGL